jgi:hypothetical protein
LLVVKSSWCVSLPFVFKDLMEEEVEAKGKGATGKNVSGFL